MQIKLSNNFEKNLYIIYEFISKDKLSAAQNFKKELLKTIKALLLRRMNLASTAHEHLAS